MSYVAYFAYGSNLWPARLAERTPSSVATAVGAVNGHTLHFHKRGQDGSGKCNLLPTGDASHRVFGALYRLHRRDLPRLDEAEGLGRGYHRAEVSVRTPSGITRAWCYQAEDGYVDDSLTPFDWYVALVLAGAAAHGLPATWTEQLARIPARADHDAERAVRHRRLLAGDAP